MPITSSIASHPALATLRARASALARQYRLDRALRRALEPAPGLIDERLIEEICDAWGSPESYAVDGHLRALLAEVPKAHGHVLQCGAGLTTVLLAVALAHRGVHLWALESNAQSAAAVRSWLAQYELNQAHVVTARAEIGRAGVGYAVDVGRIKGPLSLVICEASQAHPGNAGWILPRIADRLDPKAVVMVCDVRKREEVDAVAAWCRASDASFVVRGKTDRYVKVVLRDKLVTESHRAARINTPFATK